MSKFSHDILVLGGGAAGLTVASGAAQLGVKVALIEKHNNRLGGDCLYYGCVPSKTLIKSAKIYQYGKSFPKFGLPEIPLPKPDIESVLAHVHQVIEEVAVHDSPERFRSLGAEIIFGSPEFVSPFELRVTDPGGGSRPLSAQSIILATGSSPTSPPIPGLEQTGYLTNLNIFSLKRLPERLITIGGGPIGIELSQALLRLGSRVTLLEYADHILPREDADMAEILKARLLAEGAEIITGARVVRVEGRKGKKIVTFHTGGQTEKSIEGSEILLAAGRRGNGASLKPEQAGLKTQQGFFDTDRGLATSQQHILAIGDSNGRYLFTHVAGAEGSLAVRKAVFHLPVSMDYNSVPWVTYTDPEVASVGLNEMRAREEGVSFTTVVSEFRDVDRAVTETESEGKIKILLDKKNRIIGTQIVGAHAGELLLPSILALKNRYKLMDIMTPVFPYPVLTEIYKKAASGYYAPKIFNTRVRRILRLLFRYRGRSD